MLDFIISFLSIIFIISIPVFLHELGHYMAAKSVGIKVEKFYVGMNLFGLGLKKKINDTEYGIGLFPLGGYVKVAGIIDESLDSSESVEKKPYEFRSKNTFQKLWFLSAGVIMNFLLSIFIFTILFFSLGVEELVDEPIIDGIHENITILNDVNDTLTVTSPAKLLNLEKDNKILMIDGYPINNWIDISNQIKDKAGKEVSIKWENNFGKVQESNVVVAARPAFDGTKIVKQGVLGIVGKTYHRDISFFESIYISTNRTYDIIVSSFYGFVGIVSGNLPLKYVSGIVGIGKEAGSIAQSAGFIGLVSLMAFISSNLGLINILPIPGLDGGHATIAIVEGLIRRELPLKLKYGIQFLGLIIIFSLFAFTIFNDLKNIFN